MATLWSEITFCLCGLTSVSVSVPVSVSVSVSGSQLLKQVLGAGIPWLHSIGTVEAMTFIYGQRWNTFFGSAANQERKKKEKERDEKEELAFCC